MKNNLLFFWRLQPIHNWHVKDLFIPNFYRNWIDKIYIWLTWITKDYGLNRNKDSSNPLPFYERKKLIETFVKNEIKTSIDFDIIPFNISWIETIQKSIEQIRWKIIIIIRTDEDDKWSEIKKARFKKLKSKNNQISLEIYKNGIDRIHWNVVREIIRNGGNWQELVPKSTHKILNWMIKNSSFF